MATQFEKIMAAVRRQFPKMEAGEVLDLAERRAAVAQRAAITGRHEARRQAHKQRGGRLQFAMGAP